MTTVVDKTQLNYFAQEFYDKVKTDFDSKGSAEQSLIDSKLYTDDLNATMNTRVKNVEDDVSILKGDKNTEGSVAYQIAEIVADADTDFDTLKEIADWITNDAIGATQMVNDIKANTNAISVMQGDIVQLQTDVINNTTNITNLTSKIESIELSVITQADIDEIIASLQ